MKAQGKISSRFLTKTFCVILLLAGLTILEGCQGVSAAGSSAPPATGQLSLGVSSLDFGNVTAGSTKTLTINASNSGTKALTIGSAAVSTKYFTLVSPALPLSIGSGQSATVSVKFAPNAAGNFGATMAFTSDAADSLLNVSLSGVGITGGGLALNPASEAFGTVTVGSTQTQTVTLTNTGGTAVDVSGASVSGAGFQLSGLSTPLTLSASQSTTFTVGFAPQASGSVTGAVTITSNGSNPSLVMALSGIGAAQGDLVLNPANEAFGTVTVGSTKTQTVTLTNSGGTAINVSLASVSGSGFGLSGLTTPLTLNPSQSTTFSVAFSPQSAGSATGAVTITSNGSNPTLSMALTGTGSTSPSPQLSISPSTLGLGNVVVGTSGTASGSLSASGGSVTVTAATTNNSVFSVGGLSLPVTIASGQSVPFTITFSPQTAATVSATLSVSSSNAQPSTVTETLTGTGTPAPVHSVNLSWSASTSSNISGYNVYRATYTTTCGSYSKINSVLNTGTLYTDNAVVDGSSYCYAATAVNSSNQESPYSNIVSNVQIPAP